MDFDMATDIMNQEEQLMHIISQLDSALANLPPSISSHASPPLPTPLPLYRTSALNTQELPLSPVAANLPEEGAATREIMYSTAAMHRLVGVGTDADADADAARPRRRNVRVSSEPQSVAARLRRERVSERMRALQLLVPGGARLDTASMLEEAIRYVKFLKVQVRSLEEAAAALHGRAAAGDYPYSCPYLA